MSHAWTGSECLVAHFDKEHNLLPSCRACLHCGWVAFPYTAECVGDAPLKAVESAPTQTNMPTTPCQEAHSEYKSRFEWFYCPLCGIKL